MIYCQNFELSIASSHSYYFVLLDGRINKHFILTAMSNDMLGKKEQLW